MTYLDTPKRWHFANWSPLGWLETVIKLVAFAAAISGFINSLAKSEFVAPGGLRLIQVLVLGVLSLGLTLGIVDRYKQREIIAMIFILINNVAHWGMVIALLRLPGPGSALLIFAGLMLLGDLIKLYWLRRSGYTQDGYSPALMYGLVGTYAVGYIIVLLLGLVT